MLQSQIQINTCTPFKQKKDAQQTTGVTRVSQ